MYVRVPSAHLALVTAPVTCVGFCSIPAPIAPLWESRVMTECCWAVADAVPRTPGNLDGQSFCLGRRWPPADQFVVFYLYIRALYKWRMNKARRVFVQTCMSSSGCVSRNRETHTTFILSGCWAILLLLF